MTVTDRLRDRVDRLQDERDALERQLANAHRRLRGFQAPPEPLPFDVREALRDGITDEPVYQRMRSAVCRFSPVDLDAHCAFAALEALAAIARPRHPTSSGETASVVRASGRLPEEVTTVHG